MSSLTLETRVGEYVFARNTLVQMKKVVVSGETELYM